MTELMVPVAVEILAGEGRNASWSMLPVSELRFSTQDPIATVLCFGEGDASVEWTFAFDLLHRVSTGWANVGVGDVRFSEDPLTQSCVLLRLHSPDGKALLRIRKVDIQKFVQAVKPLLDAQPEVDLMQLAVEQAIRDILNECGPGKPVD